MTGDLLPVLDRVYATTADVIAAIPAPSLEAPSPCEGWTVWMVANHVVAGLDFVARTVEGRDVERPDPKAPDPKAPDPDLLGADPAGAYRQAADRCLAAFRRAGALDGVYPFPFGPTRGETVANISLQESLVHGWDLARGAGLPYAPDPDGVEAALRFSAGAEGSEIRRRGTFGRVQSPPPDAGDFAVLLARLGRRS